MLSWKSLIVWMQLLASPLLAERNLNVRDDTSMFLEQKTIGVIGGTSWESTALYYKLMNELTRNHLGGLNSAKMLLYSLNYDPIVNLEQREKWSEVGDELVHAAKVLENGGADFVILCCNTLHKMAPAIERAIRIPFLHIVDVAGMVLTKKQVKKVGLLGTQFTMEDGFYVQRLADKFGIETIIPSLEERRVMDRIIYHELCQGKISSVSKKNLLDMIQNLMEEGVQAILLGCTELGLLVNRQDATIPIYDTTLLHAEHAVNMSVNCGDSLFISP